MTDGDRRRRFEQVVQQVADPVRRYLWRRTDPDTAEDVLAETLLALWRRGDALPGPPIPWAIGVARLQLANAERAARRRDRLTARVIAVDPPREAALEDDPGAADGVRDVLAALRPADAELLRLWSWEGLQPAEIATVLGITANAATVRLHRAKERFRREWGKAAPDGGHIEEKERRSR